MRDIKLGLETESLHLFFQHRGLNLFEFADITADLGLDGVQINIIPDLNLNQRFGTLKSNDESYLKNLNDKILSLNLYCEIDTRWSDYELLKEDILIAKALGAKRVRSYLKPQNGEISRADFLKSIDDLERICELLERYDIELALENHEYESSDDLLYIIEKIGSNRLGVLYDTGNSMMVRRDPIIEAKKLLPYIKMVHFKDHIVCLDGDEPVVSGTFLGEGSIDIEAMFELLADHTDANINLETCYPYSATFKDPAIIAARKSGAKITKELLKALPLSSISDELYAEMEAELAQAGLDGVDLSSFFSDFYAVNVANKICEGGKNLQEFVRADASGLHHLTGLGSDKMQDFASASSDNVHALDMQGGEFLCSGKTSATLAMRRNESDSFDILSKPDIGDANSSHTGFSGVCENSSKSAFEPENVVSAVEIKSDKKVRGNDCGSVGGAFGVYFNEYLNSNVQACLSEAKSGGNSKDNTLKKRSAQATKLLMARHASNIRAYAGKNAVHNLTLKSDSVRLDSVIGEANDAACESSESLVVKSGSADGKHIVKSVQKAAVAQNIGSKKGASDSLEIGKIVHAALKAKSAERFEFKGVFEIKKAPLPKYINPMSYYYPHTISERALEELLAFQISCVRQSAVRLINLRKKYLQKEAK
ncbi:sugar phosphate isomerase/epimerase [Campylobacter sp. 19-13652]|uniref:sugar phosphate isomerase/epimerase family protein n=1 Tax=Campylobacter sp. 19-13652 TaxID=2840180 RepID=UPI001C7495C5|nr:sugar phosphate isomerase/epimerase family protein [Campylobacter sp. 19-13652]BCX78785.1 hypothetical protein LBC_02470 [Campylobacter sp. 19-13652]